MVQPVCFWDRQRGQVGEAAGIAAGKDRRDHLSAHRGVLVDLRLDEALEHDRPLGGADDDDGPAVVEVRHVVPPGRQQALVGHVGGGVDVGGDPDLRALAVDRCPHLADLGEAGGLLDGDVDLRLVDSQVGVVAALQADGRVGVEAVEPRAVVGVDAERRPGSVGGHRGRVEVRGARVVGQARPAEPHRCRQPSSGEPAVVGAVGQRLWRRCRWRRGERGRRVGGCERCRCDGLFPRGGDGGARLGGELQGAGGDDEPDGEYQQQGGTDDGSPPEPQ